MKLNKVLEIIPDTPVKIWSPETELSDTVEPCGLPLIVAWDEECGETADICTVSPELSPEVSRALSWYLVHCYNKFNDLLKAFEAVMYWCDDSDDFEDEPCLVKARAAIIDAGEVEGI